LTLRWRQGQQAVPGLIELDDQESYEINGNAPYRTFRWEWIMRLASSAVNSSTGSRSSVSGLSAMAPYEITTLDHMKLSDPEIPRFKGGYKNMRGLGESAESWWIWDTRVCGVVPLRGTL
jgi:hypothetical protein